MKTTNSIFRDGLGWGVVLWLIGYILGIVLFMAVPPALIGWIITPVASVIALWVLIKKIRSVSLQYYIFIGVIWTILAVVLDYFLLVKVFKPADGYYKPDVFLYYGLTFILPAAVGFWKQSRKSRSGQV